MDSLKTLNTIGQATTYVYNYPSKNAAGEDVVLSSALVAWSPEEPKETDSIETLHIYTTLPLPLTMSALHRNST